MSRLLTDEQVERVARETVDSLMEAIWLERPDLDLAPETDRAELLHEAAEDNLRDFLEGLHEPEGPSETHRGAA